MYLVPADQYEHSPPQPQPPPPSPPPTPVKTRSSVKTKCVAKKIKKKNITQHPHDKCVALCIKLLEADIKETDLIHRFADFPHKVLPQAAHQTTPQRHPPTEPRPKIEMVDIAATPQLSHYHSGRSFHLWVMRASVSRCRNVALAAVAKMPKRPILMTMCEEFMWSRVNI